MKINIGDIYSSNSFGDFRIMKLLGKNKHRRYVYEIKFLDTGYITTSDSQAIRKGYIKDYYYPKIGEIGYMGYDFSDIKKGVFYKKIYNTWKKMLQRCYCSNNPNYKKYGLKGVYVDKEWHSFYNFYNDVKLLDGWNLEHFLKGRLNLDKDLKCDDLGYKKYSKDTCIWLDEHINKNSSKKYFKTPVLATHTDGRILQVRNIREFAIQNNLTSPNISVCIKNGKMHKGWKFKVIND